MKVSTFAHDAASLGVGKKMPCLKDAPIATVLNGGFRLGFIYAGDVENGGNQTSFSLKLVDIAEAGIGLCGPQP